MFIVGLTGGIGSGKTAASDYFSELGIDVVDADIASRTVVEAGKPALQNIAEHFGGDILLADGTLDRALLRAKIFSNPDEKTWLEALLHPLIAEQVRSELEAASSDYAIFVSPLLIESQQDRICDRVLVIDVPEELQVTRATQRDHNDAAQVKRMIASQATREQRLEKATDVVVNTSTLQALHKELGLLHQHYQQLAAEKVVGE